MDLKAVKDLQRSGITKKEAEYAGMFFDEDCSSIYEEFQALPGLVIPYFEPTTQSILSFENDKEEKPFCRVRYLSPPAPKPGFKKAKNLRYGQPRKSGARAYFPITKEFDWRDILEDTGEAIVFTEGEKKALRACLAGMPTIGLGGVFNFMREGKFLPELDHINWRGRPVYIAFDSDADQNPHIQAAEGRLATELSLDRQAQIHLARMPNIPGHDKVGIDDLIVAKGEDAFFDLLEAAIPMRKIDTSVISLNKDVAFIESEGVIYELFTDTFIKKDVFIQGSKYSAQKIIIPTSKAAAKTISVAREWLTHPHAQRYTAVRFLPGDDRQTVPAEKGGQALNLFRGFHAEPGDVSLFLELTDWLMKDTEPELRDLPIKLMAFKAQNPQFKIPMAPLFVGSAGSGKSLWASSVERAFAPHSTNIQSRHFKSDFNGWLEQSLVVRVDELRPEDVNSPIFASIQDYITNSKSHMNEKFRKSHDVDNFAAFIFTTNKRGAASFSYDDRRFFVISTPPPMPDKDFYTRYGAWLDHEGGPKQLMHFLLNYDLNGWRPPNEAPQTAEKYMAYIEGLTPAQRIAEEARSADEHVLAMWIEQAQQWASTIDVSANPASYGVAQKVLQTYMQLPIRPWYTPEEITLLHPMITESLYSRKSRGAPANELSRQLREAGIPYLRNLDDRRGFMWKGRIRQFLVMAEIEEWGKPITQEKFDYYMKRFYTYKEWRKALKSSKR